LPSSTPAPANAACCWTPQPWPAPAAGPAPTPGWRSSPKPSTSFPAPAPPAPSSWRNPIFPGAGATGALVLAESHLAVHTWPELDGVTLDLYVCNHSRDNRAAAESAFAALRQAFLPRQVVRRDLHRGAIPAAMPASVA